MRSLVLALLIGLGSCPVKPPKPPEPPTCPSTCPHGTACTDAAKGCEFIPAPGPICGKDEFCGCYHMPPTSETWLEATCPVGQQCNVNRQCETAPPPPVEGCVLAGEPTTATSSPNLYGDLVNQVMHELHPECEIGGRCELGNTTPNEWYDAVNKKLRAKGKCAGRHSDHTDEIAVAEKRNTLWLGYHIFAGDDSNGPVPPGGSPRLVRWSPQAYMGAWVPPDVVTPPTPEECPNPKPDRVWLEGEIPPGWDPNLVGKPRLQILSKMHTGDWVDTTLTTIRNLSYCEKIGMSPMANGVPRDVCPMRPDGHPERVACERYAAEGNWIVVSDDGLPCEQNAENSAQFRARGGHCRLCNPAKTVCSTSY